MTATEQNPLDMAMRELAFTGYERGKQDAEAALLPIIRRLANAWRPLLERGFYGSADLDEARAALAEADAILSKRPAD